MNVTELIQNVGFPIFAFLCAGFACKYVYDRETKRAEQNSKAVQELTIAVNHNSESILRLCDKLDSTLDAMKELLERKVKE